jgi:hypothetical protein
LRSSSRKSIKASKNLTTTDLKLRAANKECHFSIGFLPELLYRLTSQASGGLMLQLTCHFSQGFILGFQKGILLSKNKEASQITPFRRQISPISSAPIKKSRA